MGCLGGSPANCYWDLGFCVNGSGSTLSSGKDLIQFLESIMDASDGSSSTAGSIGSVDSVLQQALFQSLKPLHFEMPTSGLAHSWFFGQCESDEGTVCNHDGSTEGFSAAAWFQPKTQTGFSAMSNCFGGISGLASVCGVAEAINDRLFLVSEPLPSHWENIREETQLVLPFL